MRHTSCCHEPFVLVRVLLFDTRYEPHGICEYVPGPGHSRIVRCVSQYIWKRTRLHVGLLQQARTLIDVAQKILNGRDREDIAS